MGDADPSMVFVEEVGAGLAMLDGVEVVAPAAEVASVAVAALVDAEAGGAPFVVGVGGGGGSGGGVAPFLGERVQLVDGVEEGGLEELFDSVVGGAGGVAV